MRIRTVKPEFFLHDGIFDAEVQEKLPLRIAFIGLWCAADRSGRFRWEPRRLGAAILPYDGIDFSRVLDALATRGFIEKHASSGIDFGVIPSFGRHQVINNREMCSALPIPSKESMVIGSPTREARVDHASPTRDARPKAEGKGRGREGEGKEEGLTALVAEDGDQPAKIPKGAQTFIDLWNDHAKKSGLATIKEWTTKRATRLKALAATYSKGMGEAMPLAVQECHKAAWAIQNRVNVDHILVPDNFQRYLDKARTGAATPQNAAAASSQPAATPKTQRNTPAWVAGKIKEIEAKIATRKRERQKYEWEKREQSVKEMDQEIFELEIQLNALK